MCTFSVNNKGSIRRYRGVNVNRLNAAFPCRFKIRQNFDSSDCIIGGGGAVMKYSTSEFLNDFVEPYGTQLEANETYYFVDHTDDVGLLAYSKDTYIFADIPLRDLLPQITVIQARNIMKHHNITCHIGKLHCMV
jgi:hypothetical protein